VDFFDCHGVVFAEGVEDCAVVFCCLELFLGEEFEALWFVGDVVLVWHGCVLGLLYLNVIGCQAVFINIFICQPLTLCDNGE